MNIVIALVISLLSFIAGGVFFLLLLDEALRFLEIEFQLGVVTLETTIAIALPASILAIVIAVIAR